MRAAYRPGWRSIAQRWRPPSPLFPPFHPRLIDSRFSWGSGQTKAPLSRRGLENFPISRSGLAKPFADRPRPSVGSPIPSHAASSFCPTGLRTRQTSTVDAANRDAAFSCITSNHPVASVRWVGSEPASGFCTRARVLVLVSRSFCGLGLACWCVGRRGADGRSPGPN